MGFTAEQIDAMVRDADLVARTAPEVSPVADVCIHVKALAAMVEELRNEIELLRAQDNQEMNAGATWWWMR